MTQPTIGRVWIIVPATRKGVKIDPLRKLNQAIIFAFGPIIDP